MLVGLERVHVHGACGLAGRAHVPGAAHPESHEVLRDAVRGVRRPARAGPLASPAGGRGRGTLDGSARLPVLGRQLGVAREPEGAPEPRGLEPATLQRGAREVAPLALQVAQLAAQGVLLQQRAPAGPVERPRDRDPLGLVRGLVHRDLVEAVEVDDRVEADPEVEEVGKGEVLLGLLEAGIGEHEDVHVLALESLRLVEPHEQPIHASGRHLRSHGPPRDAEHERLVAIDRRPAVGQAFPLHPGEALAIGAHAQPADEAEVGVQGFPAQEVLLTLLFRGGRRSRRQRAEVREADQAGLELPRPDRGRPQPDARQVPARHPRTDLDCGQDPERAEGPHGDAAGGDHAPTIPEALHAGQGPARRRLVPRVGPARRAPGGRSISAASPDQHPRGRPAGIRVAPG